MRIISILALAILFSCALPQERPDLINGYWTAWVITVEGVEFSAPRGVRGVRVEVLLYKKEGHWYMWPSGEEIHPL